MRISFECSSSCTVQYAVMSVVENSVHRNLAVPFELVPSLAPKTPDPNATPVRLLRVKFGVWSSGQAVVTLYHLVLCGVSG